MLCLINVLQSTLGLKLSEAAALKVQYNWMKRTFQVLQWMVAWLVLRVVFVVSSSTTWAAAAAAFVIIIVEQFVHLHFVR